MTKPYLYIDGDKGHYNNLYFPGDSNGFADAGATLTDNDTTHNLLNMEVGCVLGAASHSATGTDCTFIAFQAPPVEAFTGTIVDDVINAGVVGIEWTGTGVSEQLNISPDDYVFTYGENGRNFEAGAWVYLESSTSTDIKFSLRFESDAPASILQDIESTVVQPNTWTYITVTSTLNPTQESNSRRARLFIEANGAQTIGDKLYVGACAIGPGVASGWVYPVGPASSTHLDFRFTAKILGNGTIFDNRSGEAAANDGDVFHVECDNNRLRISVGTRSTTSVLTTDNATSDLGIIDFDRWYRFRWTYDTSGQHTFYINGEVAWTGTTTARAGRLGTMYGIQTRTAGVVTLNSTHALINSFGMYYDDTFGWEASGLDDHSLSFTGDLLGSELVIYSDGLTESYNEAFYAAHSGWIINASSTEKGALQLPSRSELKFGTGDYTVVQSFAAVASHAGFTPTYDDFGTDTGLKFRQTSDVFSVLSGPVTVALPTNPLDGTYRSLLVERDSGVAVNAYVDDFDVVTASGGDGGADISNGVSLTLGATAGLANNSLLPMLLGVTITFNRLLDEGEKRDLQFWIEDGFQVESEPEWLRTEAILYLNPNDPVQRAEYNARDRIINLALDVPDGVYLRYDFTSIDGSSNPVLSYNEVRFANAQLEEELELTNGYENGPVPKIPMGHGVLPEIGRMGGGSQNYVLTVPLEELGEDWVDGDWTVNFWATLTENNALEEYIVGQGPFITANAWSIRKTAFETIRVDFDVNEVIQTSGPIVLGENMMVTVTKSGTSYEIYLNAVLDSTNTSSASNTIAHDLTYGGYVTENNFSGLLGPLQIWDRALTTGEIQALYNSSTSVSSPIDMGTAAVTDSFATSSRVWERI